MELIINIILNNDLLTYNYYGSIEKFILKNVSTQNNGIYKFKKPQTGSKDDRFIIEYFGNKPTVIDGMNYEIAHYILKKNNENSNYLLSITLFNQIFELDQ